MRTVLSIATVVVGIMVLSMSYDSAQPAAAEGQAGRQSGEEVQGAASSPRPAETAQRQQRKGTRPKATRRRRAGRRRQSQLPAAKIAGEFPAERISLPGKQSDWPAVAVSADGATWVAYVEWNGKDSDRVSVRRRPPGGHWSEPISLDDGCHDHYWPAIAARGTGALVCWSGQKDGNFELYAAEVTEAGRPSGVQQITHAPRSDFNVRAAADRRGNVIVVWQSLRDGQGDIYARRLTTDGTWNQPVRVSPSDAGDWQPVVALDSSGRAWIAWDSYHRGNYDVFLRDWDGKQLGPVVSITTRPRAQFHTSVAVDRQDRIWVAWDEGCRNWGKDLSRSSTAEGNDGLHGSRQLGIRVYAGGRLWNLTPELSGILTGRMERYAELPRLGFDAGGTLWMVFRHWTETRPTEIYHFYVTRLTPDGWAEPWRLADSSGRNSQYADFARDPSGSLLVAYAGDGRSPQNLPKDQVHSLPYQIQLAKLDRNSTPGKVALEPFDPPPAPSTRFTRRERYTTTIAGRQYTLLYGDCHRHTDIRGHSGIDASIMDTLRYALDAGQLDFMGFGDHNEVFGGRWPDGLRDYSWWYSQKLVDLHHCPPTFVGLYSYEHSMSRPAGHRNMIFLKRGAPLRMIDRQGGITKPDNQPPNLWEWVRQNVLTQPGQKVVIVPHTFAAGPLADWNWPNPEFDCLLEIYQGCRGSYEAWNLPKGEKRGPTQTDEPGHFARDALAKGNRYGFVSFSDHRSTHNSFACVWAERVDREAIIDAMLARRTFGASDEIVLDVTADQHAMGEEFTAGRDRVPTLNIYARAPDTILRIDVVKDGQYVYTHRPNSRQSRVAFRDSNVQPGSSYYYVRLFQRDPEAPEGDPEIAWASPFFVNYER